MRAISISAVFASLAVGLLGCPGDKTSTEKKSLNPYHDVTPKKIGAQVEKIEKDEAERNDRRLEQAK